MEERDVSAEALKGLHYHHGFDKPLYVQYGKFLQGLITGKMQSSLRYEGRTTIDILKQSFPISALLGGAALISSIVWGILLGSIAAIFRGKWPDYLVTIVTVLGISIPSFVLAPLLQLVFSFHLKWFPIARLSSYKHAILPILSLSASPTAFMIKLIKSNMLEILHKDYILTARSKGLSGLSIWKNHLIKNSLLPAFSYIGYIMVNLLTGSFAVEKTFGIPGLGFWLVNSIICRDYPIIMGLTLFYSTLLIIVIFLFDILYIFLDPRIKNALIH